MPKLRDMNGLQIFFLLVGFSLLVQGQILMAILPFWIAVGGDISWQELNQNPSSEVNDE
jgi:hypothetical protein